MEVGDCRVPALDTNDIGGGRRGREDLIKFIAHDMSECTVLAQVIDS